MSTPVAVIGLTYDSTDIQILDGLFLQILNYGATPDVRGEDTIVPGDEGRTPGNRVNDMLPIFLGGWVRGVGDTEADARAALAVNRAATMILFASNRQPANLVATLEDGSVATVLARPKPGLLIKPLGRVHVHQDVNVELEGYGNWDIEPAAS